MVSYLRMTVVSVILLMKNTTNIDEMTFFFADTYITQKRLIRLGSYIAIDNVLNERVTHQRTEMTWCLCIFEGIAVKTRGSLFAVEERMDGNTK